MRADSIAFGMADVTNCDRERIHTPGSIQPHGCLIALAPGDLIIVQAGGNTRAVLSASPDSLIGSSLGERIGAPMAAALRACSDMAAQSRRLFAFDGGPAAAGDVWAATVHKSGGLVILELEPAQASDGYIEDAFGLVHDLALRVQQAQSVEAFCQAMADCVREVSGFDRVMVYRFLPDGAGAVDAEALGPGAESYLGLRYPASDIPLQARDLYLRNTVRLIPDARYTPAPIFGGARAGPLDLSHSVLRSVSPIHLEYLANMGVAASMSLSIVVEGRLWGLIACHHLTPRFLPSRIRAALDLFAQMASFQLETRLTAEALADRARGKAIHETLMTDLAGGGDIAEGLQRSRRALLDYLPAAGLALWVDGQFAAIAETPSRNEVMGLVTWLNETVTEGVFHTDRLSADYSPAADFRGLASGMLSISVSRVPRDYLIWFRSEQIETVRWAGDPNKPAMTCEEGGRLSPRTSFADWKQEVRGRSAPWSPVDIKTAQSLRVSVLEVVLEHVDQLARERQRARVQQDALLAQLDDKIAQWERTAEQLKVESDRRAVVESELSQVLRRTVIDQESERQRIARELHDSLGQYLTAMKMDLDGIARDETTSTTIKARIERLKALTTDAGHEVNHLAWEIRPTSLDDLGLQTALQQFLEEWSERSPLKFDLHLTLKNRRLHPAIESTLYRVLQEAIHNVVKHAGATRVGVILAASETEVRLIVEDDGKGFDLNRGQNAAGPSARLGLLGVRERLALVGGTLEVETAPRRGTTLLIHVPL